MDGPIASAVLLPEEPPEELRDELPDAPPAPPSPPPSLKRRQSSTSEEFTKKPRLEAGNDAPTDQQQATNGRMPLRRERGRERRLFGAVIGALAQTSTAGQRRRDEIEKRQAARRKQEDEEDGQRRAERVARRKAQRLKEHRRFEKESMRFRHENLLNMAHFLRTDAEPRLYYKPWDTSPEEEARIQAQIAEAHETIERERAEYEAREEQETRPQHNASDEASRDAEGSNTGKSYNADGPQVPSATNGGTNGSADSPKDLDLKVDHADSHRSEAIEDASAMEYARRDNMASHETNADEASKDSYDDHGEDVVEEAAEDTVIY